MILSFTENYLSKRPRKKSHLKREQLNDNSEKLKRQGVGYVSEIKGRTGLGRELSPGSGVSNKLEEFLKSVYCVWQPNDHWYLCRSIFIKWRVCQVQCRILKIA